MKKFRFSLEALLRHRRRLQEQRQRVVASRLDELARVEDQLREVTHDISQRNDELRARHLTGPLDMDYISAHRRYLNAAQQHLANRIGRTEQLRQRLDLERASLVRASQQTRVIERLRDRRYDEYRKDVSRAQAAHTNEVALNVYRRADREALLW